MGFVATHALNTRGLIVSVVSFS